MVVVFGHPVGHILSTFWATHVINFATWEGVYSVFPQSTLDKKWMAHFGGTRASHLLGYEKYRQRGYTLAPSDETGQLAELSGKRRVGDSMTKRYGFSKTMDEQLDAQYSVKFNVSRKGVRISHRKYDSESE